ncbi:MAG: hypothetical protein OHK0012_01180 [Synechococcales cyanobacterium]
MADFETLGGRVSIHLDGMEQVELLELLGAGTYGRVWRCRDPESQRIYALKVITGIRPDSYLAAKVQQEASVRIESPYVVPALGCCQWDPGTFLILFEFVSGSPLNHRLSQNPSGSLKAQWFEQILLGVEQAHRHQIIHRDLKPNNILVDQDNTIKIIDFGMAKFKADKTITKTGLAIGTPPYMAPEVLVQGGQVADARADIYSLGQILYEMAVGVSFWTRQGWRGLDDFLFYLGQTPPPLSCIDLAGFTCDWLPHAATVLLRMTRTQPQRRYGSIAEVFQDLYGPRDPVCHPYLMQREHLDALTLIPLHEGESLTLGRLDIAGADPSISKNHLQFHCQNGLYWVTDLGSRNGSWLRGSPLGAEPQLIDSGDSLTLGHVELTFVIPSAP